MLITGRYAAANWPLVGQAAAILTILYCLPLEQAFPRTVEWKLNLHDIGQATTWNVLLDRVVYPLTFALGIIPLVEVLSGFRDGLHIAKLWPAEWPLPLRTCLALLLFQIFEYGIHRCRKRYTPHHHAAESISVSKNGKFRGAVAVGTTTGRGVIQYR